MSLGVVPDVSKACSVFVLKGKAIHKERLLDPWERRHYIALEQVDHYQPYPAGLETLRNKLAM
jgi:hypothetical protein